MPGEIQTWLTNTINKITQFGSNLASKGKEGAKNLVNNIINTIKSLPSKMLDFGKNIVEGLWNGIKNATNWIKDKVKNFAKGILDGMKNALGIHSPSTLFRDEIGINLGLGLGEGFEDSLSGVYKNMKKAVDYENAKLTSNLTSSHQISLTTEDNRQSILQSIDNNREIQVNSTLNLDGKIVANTVNKVNARQKLQYGIA